MVRRTTPAPYGLVVGTTGVIFGAIAIAWLAYLVPHFVRKRDDEAVVDVDDPAERFAGSMRVVQHGTAPLLDQDLSEIGTYEVSTPLTRRAAVADLRRLERVAALRRRRVLLALMAVLSLVVGSAGAELIPWWSTAIPGGLVVLFFAVSRFSVIGMRRSLDARYADISAAGTRSPSSSTGPRSRPRWKPAHRRRRSRRSRRRSPAPECCGTRCRSRCRRMSRSRSRPRTVRTIDLSGPAVTAGGPIQHPVTADARPGHRCERRRDLTDESGERRAASCLRLRW